MISPGQIRRAIKHPSNVASKFFKYINHRNKKYNTEGINIFAEDWDNLVILDACRYDSFSQHVNYDGELESRISRGSHSQEFVRGNFQGENNYHDTVYCSYNRWYEKLAQELGEERQEVYRFDVPEIPVHKRDLGHVREECQRITERALELHSEHPHKRLITHYMVPHEPYVDRDGEILVRTHHEHEQEPATILDLVPRRSSSEDYVEVQTIRQAYETSVVFILSHIKRLISELAGKTVVTADHGELLGERMWPFPTMGFQHPQGVYMEELVRVPWFICEYEERREIIHADEPHSSMKEYKIHTDEIDQHLRDMGYRV